MTAARDESRFREHLRGMPSDPRVASALRRPRVLAMTLRKLREHYNHEKELKGGKLADFWEWLKAHPEIVIAILQLVLMLL